MDERAPTRLRLEIEELPPGVGLRRAAWLARRVLPMFCEVWPEAPSFHIRSLDYGLGIVEKALATGEAPIEMIRHEAAAGARWAGVEAMAATTWQHDTVPAHLVAKAVESTIRAIGARGAGEAERIEAAVRSVHEALMLTVFDHAWRVLRQGRTPFKEGPWVLLEWAAQADAVAGAPGEPGV